MSESPHQREYGHHLVDEVRAGRMTRRDLVRRATIVGLALPSVSALVSACGGGDEAGPATTGTAKGETTAGKPGGTMRVAMLQPTAALDPVTNFDEASIGAAQVVGDYLNWVEPDQTLRPVLAEKWESDESGRTWTFTLREGVNFSDGQPMTADDVIATFDRLADPKVGDADVAGILTKGNTEKLDDRTIAFHLDRPFVDFPVLAGVANYNAVILPAEYAGDFEKNPVGTGAFVLTNIVAKQNITFEKNTKYWAKGRPLLDAVEFRFFAENQPQVLALQGGDVDMMLDTPFQGSQALFSDANIEVLEASASAYRSLHMRVDQEPWSDKRVRQALAFALDRQQLVDALLQQKGDIGHDHIFAPLYALDLDVPERTQDYDRAKQLLAEAGHPNGVKATLTTENYLEIPQYVQIVQEMAKPAGFAITLDIQDQAKYYGSGDNQPWLEVPLGVVDWTSRPVVAQHTNLAYTCKAVWNSAKWCNEEFDRLSAEFDATLDETRRREIATRMATIQQDEVPVIIAYWLRRFRAVAKNVRGVEADPAANLDLTEASFA